MPTRKELLIDELCDEIDYYKAEAERYKRMWEQATMALNRVMNDNTHNAEEMMGMCIEAIIKKF